MKLSVTDKNKTMKTIFFLLSLSFSVCVHAQTNANTQPAFTYDTCSYLQACEGEWMYANGQDTIRVYLRAQRSRSLDFRYISDNLWGWHEYKRGITVVESSYRNRFAPLPYDRDSRPDGFESIFLRTDSCYTGFTFLGGGITDLSQCNERMQVKATLNSSRTTMTWRQSHSDGYGFISGCYGMTLPRQFVLQKQ